MTLYTAGWICWEILNISVTFIQQESLTILHYSYHPQSPTKPEISSHPNFATDIFRIAKRHLDKPNFCPAIASLANSALHRHVYRTKAMALEDTTRMSSTSPEQRLNPNPSGISVYCTGFLGILIHPAQI